MSHFDIVAAIQARLIGSYRYCQNQYSPDEVVSLTKELLDETSAGKKLRQALDGFLSGALSTTELGAAIESAAEGIEELRLREFQNKNTGDKYT